MGGVFVYKPRRERRRSLPSPANDPGWTSPRGPRALPRPGRFEPRRLPGFGKRVPKPLSPRLPGVGRVPFPGWLPLLPGAGGLADDAWDAWRNPDPYRLPASTGFELCCGPNALPYRDFVYVKEWFSGGHCNACGLLGQAITTTELWEQGVLINSTVIQIGLLSRNNPPGLGGGYAIHKVWNAKPVSPFFYLPKFPTTFSPSVPDPNPLRRAPAARPGPDTAEPPFEPSPEPPPYTYSRPPRGEPASRGGRREPPNARVKEKKMLNRSKRFGAALFAALDAISENAELIDAFYDALPKDVRDRWGKGRDDRGLIDTAGQYGIDGADWKMQALWHNWHKVDPLEAFKNIFKNQVEDKVIGYYQRHLPRNVGRAFHRQLPQGKSLMPEGIVAKQVDDAMKQLFEWLGI